MREADVPAFEDALGQLASVVERDLGKSAANIPGSGAAGGLGFGLAVFCDAEIVRGFELVSDLIGLEQMVSEVDVVVTGEGSLDAQSMSGKVPVALAALASSKGKPILCVAGRIDTSVDWTDKFSGLLSTCGCAGSYAAALADASGWLQEACRRLCEAWERNKETSS
jgi:glycerate kinase